jgi:hypothetical protein
MAGPALLPPLRGPLVDVDRVQALQDRHATLRPLIATLDHHECATAMNPFRIGVGFLIRDAHVGERLQQVCSCISGVPLDGRVFGLAALGVVQSQMDIAPCKAVRDQLLHHTLSVCARVIECYQCLCHTTTPLCLFLSVRDTLNLYLFAA